MSRRARNNARYELYKREMQRTTESSDVGTRAWRRRHGFTVDEVRAMRAKHRRELRKSGDLSVIPTPVRRKHYRNQRTANGERMVHGSEYDLKQVLTRVKRYVRDTEVAATANPGDVRAEFDAREAKRALASLLELMEARKFSRALPTTQAPKVEDFTSGGQP